MTFSRWLGPLALASTVVVSSLAGAASARAATITVINHDGAGEGFNDPTPVSPAGGNTATTLGQARLEAFAFAASRWGSRLVSAVPVMVDAQLSPLACTATSALLGAAGTNTVHRDFPFAPIPNTWYPQALANSMSALDLDPTSADIFAEFSSALDSGACLGGSRWYYGLDGTPPPGDLDFVTVVLHELGHGLGFQAFVALGTGAKLLGRDDTYMRNLEHHAASPPSYPAMTDAQRVTASTSDPNLHWTGVAVNSLAASLLSSGIFGGHAGMNGPSPQRPGSSVSHFNPGLHPNELMEPFYSGPDHELDLTLQLMRDLGWVLTPAVMVPALSWWAALGLASLLAAIAHLTVRGRVRRGT